MANPKIKAISDIPIPNIGFNLNVQEQFATEKGICFEHWAAIPSAIGKKDRGDYRRPDSLDTISEGGFLYKKMGEFVGTIVNNSKRHDFNALEGGIYDNSTARLVIPVKYKKKCTKKQEISLLPGDRVYAKDMKLKVDNYQEVDYNPNGSDVLQFPALDVIFLRDSNNKEFKCGKDFKINKDGNIKWVQGGNNPGIDVETGKGRIYSVRYTYNAFWYVQQLMNEIRVTNTEDSSKPARLPYHAVIQREYVYHDKLRGDAKNSNTEETVTERTKPEPQDSIDPNQFEVQVDIRNFSE